MRRWIFWVFILVVVTFLCGLVWKIVYTPNQSRFNTKNHASFATFLSFDAAKSGFSHTQLETLDQMALANRPQALAERVRDMETNQFIDTPKIFFSETTTLTKPYYEPMIDQQRKVIYAFMQRCQVGTCWIDLYRDPAMAERQPARSFVIMYMNAWYALTHERRATDLEAYFQNRDSYIGAALRVLESRPSPRVTWLERLEALIIHPVYAGCDGDYECGRLVYKYKCPDGYVGSCVNTLNFCTNQQGDIANCIPDGTICEATNSKSCSTKDTEAKCKDGARGACSISECTDGLSYGCSWGGGSTSPTNTPAPGQPTSAPVPAPTAPFPAFKGHFA